MVGVHPAEIGALPVGPGAIRPLPLQRVPQRRERILRAAPPGEQAYDKEARVVDRDLRPFVVGEVRLATLLDCQGGAASMSACAANVVTTAFGLVLG